MQAVRRLKRGEIDGLEILIARYQVKAVGTAFLITQDEALAEDVVQDVFVHLYHHIRRFDENRPFRPYLMRSVVNAALDAVEREAKWVHFSSNGDESKLEELIYQAASVEDQVVFAQLKREIQDALFRLPPNQRAVIIQRYYLEMSEREMATALDAAPGTVKWWLHTARARLRTLLGAQRRAK
jgi:RNA polymerase sigma-70 factor (ECF subfamily)